MAGLRAWDGNGAVRLRQPVRLRGCCWSGGIQVRAGDLVLPDNGAANHDAKAFPDPDRFDITRQAASHLTFGHGPHYCIGAPLARVGLQTVFSRLIPRFPDVRLAVPADQLTLDTGVLTGG